MKDQYEDTISVCAHNVTIRYWDDQEITVEDREWLRDEAEERVTACINDGCVSGELCTESNEGREFSGWWEIQK